MLAENEASIADLVEDTPKKIDWNTKLFANLLEQSPGLNPAPNLELDLAMGRRRRWTGHVAAVWERGWGGKRVRRARHDR